MFDATIFSSVLLFASPPGTPPDWGEQAAQICAPMPPAPSNVEVRYFDDTRADGSYVWAAEATYQLSTGDLAEAYLEGDSAGRGEVYFAINGEVISHTTITEGDETSGGVTSSWTPHVVSHSPELIAELVHPRVVEAMAHGMGPQEFKCSKFGRKVMKAAKYAMYGTATAVTAACCGTITVGCLACAFAAGTAAGAAGDAFDSYCE